MDSLKYYDQNAKLYFEQTHSMERYHASIEKHLHQFLSLLPEDAYILDFGCGSGRDSKYLLEHGYRVHAIDGSAAMCELASDYVAPEDLPDIFTKMLRALKPQGVICTSFKLGDGVKIKEGKTYIQTTPEKLGELLSQLPEKSEIIDTSTNISPKRSKPGRNHWGNYYIRKI